MPMFKKAFRSRREVEIQLK